MWADFVKMLSCYAPHLGEELWQRLGNEKSLAYESWPSFDAAFVVDEKKTIIVQVNGKLRGKFEAAAGASEEELVALARENEGAKKFIDGKTEVKVICVPDKLVNIVVK